MKTNCRVSGIVFKEGKVAVVRHENKMHGTYYLLPGGGLEHDETIDECAVREVKEEIGLDVKAKGLIYYEDVVSSYDHTLHLIFNCEIIRGNLEVLDPDKKVKEIIFVDENELKRLKFFPENLKERLFRDKGITVPISLGKIPYPE
ncbi:NUDIX hydrolase [Candidatus Pacearchaeota archaeon]|nr:NUDIX hydrolase [Candidatus Pacearchaeota archaeon]